jgi:RNA polymerase sigma-70 factor (family 1)
MSPMSAHQGNDRILVDRFLQGDETAFIEIYERYWYKLFLSSYRRVKDKCAAEELVQNLFLKLWEKRGVLTIDQLDSYLFSSIRNATIDFISKKMVADKYLEYCRAYTASQSNTTEEMVQLGNLEEAIEKGLQTLSGKSEKIFRLHRIEHWPVDRIASHLHLSEKTVHYHLTRSVKFIRSYLQEFTLVIFLLLR